MKSLLIILGFSALTFQAKAHFFDKLINKATDTAANTLEKKVEDKVQKQTNETFDKVFESDKENKKSTSEQGITISGGKTILITQSIFEKNAMALTTNKVPDLDKAGAYLNENPNARTIIKSHVESDENAADLSEFRSMLLKTMLVRKYELNEDYISIEICEPGKPNNRNVEIIIN